MLYPSQWASIVHIRSGNWNSQHSFRKISLTGETIVDIAQRWKRLIPSFKSLPRSPKRDKSHKRTTPWNTNDDNESLISKRGRSESVRSDAHSTSSRPLSPQQRQSRPHYYHSLSLTAVHGSPTPSSARRQTQSVSSSCSVWTKGHSHHRSPSPCDSLVQQWLRFVSRSASSTSFATSASQQAGNNSQSIASIVSAKDGPQGEIIK